MYQSHFIKRIHARYPIEASIAFSKQSTDNLLPAKMRNISDGGMYFETNHPVAPWSDICIWLKQKPSKTNENIQIYDFYRSKVLWCREIKGNDVLGIGVKHVNRTRFTSGPEFTCDICDDRIPLGKVYFMKDFLYFCPECQKKMGDDTDKNKEEVLRFLEGNVL